MTQYKYLMVITNRELAEDYFEFFRRYKVEHVIEKFCNGTADDSVLDYFSLRKTEKVMFEAIVDGGAVPALIRGMRNEMNIEAIGNGIAMFIPIDAIGGASSKRYFTLENSTESENGEIRMNEQSNSVLLITIVNTGYTEVVMEAAKAAGATGGTVIHAHGTGTDVAKFFGISISEEKDMVHIVAPLATRDAIMRAIMEKAGVNTDAHGILYSLPIDTVVGIKS